MVILEICLVRALPCTRYTLRDTLVPLVRSQGSPPGTYYLTRPPAVVTAKTKRKTTVPWLSSSRSERRVLQRRRQPTPTHLI